MNYKNINPYIIGNLLRFYYDEKIIGREGLILYQVVVGGHIVVFYALCVGLYHRVALYIYIIYT